LALPYRKRLPESKVYPVSGLIIRRISHHFAI
jgi:hypothetical protein